MDKIDVIMIELQKIQKSGTGEFTIPLSFGTESPIMTGLQILKSEFELIASKKSKLSANQRQMVTRLYESKGDYNG